MTEHTPKFDLSPYHQQRIAEAAALARHSSGGLLLATYTHPGVDPEQRVVTGDMLWNELRSQMPLTYSTYNLIWEPMPTGFNNSLEVVTRKEGETRAIHLSSGYATLPWWNREERTFFRELAGQLSHQLDGLSEFLQDSDLVKNPSVLNRVLENVAWLRVAQRDSFDSARERYPVSYYQTLYRQLVAKVFGEKIALQLPETEAYSQSAAKTIQQLLVKIANEVGLGNILSQTLTHGQATLLVSGDHRLLSHIGFSMEKKTFTCSDIDPKTGRRVSKLRNIPEQKVVEDLNAGVVLPTGKIAVLALLYLAQNQPVLHDGNEYGATQQTQERLPSHTTYYWQVFEDYRNSWAVVRINNGTDRPIIPSLSTLALLTNNPNQMGLLLREALRSGNSTDLDYEELISL